MSPPVTFFEEKSDDKFKSIIEKLREKKKNLINKRKWNGWTMADYKQLDPILNLSSRSILLVPLNEKIYPFRYGGKEDEPWTEINATETGYWWNSYNAIKHNAAFEEANLNNVIQALAALFLLFIASNHIYTIKAHKYNYIIPGTYVEGLGAPQVVSTRLFSR